MAKWLNSDGLLVKFGIDEADVVKGGQLRPFDDTHVVEFVMPYTDALSASYVVIGQASNATDGAYGIMIPKGARILSIETLVDTAFTSSGTLASSVLSFGLNKMSDNTVMSNTAFTSASYTGSQAVLQTVGSRVTTIAGGVGAGAYLGTTITDNGLVTVANTTHATNPFTAGSVRVKIRYYYI